ncbi:11734_t:CDS:2 [Funneliformis mosseae]|uniref:11734_t:CDS:1 n=1 Tax=Funneliformis mosseae TaxID=27381 RepID=A0A9N8ZG32_FUNMO|nr:11734_t:CDS:2 [Funneliformis mosseae]
MKGINIAILTTFVLAILYATTSVASIPVKAGIEKPSVTLFSRSGINNFEIDSNDFSSEAFIRSRKRNGDISVRDDAVDVDVNENEVNAKADATLNINKRNADISATLNDFVEGSANEDEVTTADASSIVKILNKRQVSSEVDSNSSVGKR